MTTLQQNAHPGKLPVSSPAVLGGIVMLGILASAVPSLGFDSIAPFIDPLHSMGDVRKARTMVPGDETAAACPAVKAVTNPLTLSEAVDLALCNNPKIKAEWASIKIQAGLVGEARAASMPTLSANINFMRTHTAYPGSGIAATTVEGETINAAFSWRLFDFGGRSANRKWANSLLAAAITAHEATLQKTLSEVIQAYFDTQTAKSTMTAKEELEQLAKTTLEAAQRREARGVVGRSDTLQATTALAKAVLEKNRATGAYNKAVAVLAYVLGVPTGSSLQVAEEIRDSGEFELQTLDHWLQLAAKHHPAILSARAQLEAAQFKRTATRAEGLPTVDFSANYYQNGYPGQGMSNRDSQIHTIGASLSFPIFEGFARTYKIRGAEAATEQRRAVLQDVEHGTLLEVVKSHADATTSLQNLQASESLQQAAREAMQVSQRKYAKGAADILEVLATQAALADARLERIRCLTEWRSSRLRLLADVGVMGRTDLRRHGD